MSQETISNLLQENRRFDPPEAVARDANVTAAAYEAADADWLGFWAKEADRITWAEPFTDVLDWTNPPFAKWYVGGKLNAAYNCVDRHVEAGNGDRVAYHRSEERRVGKGGKTQDRGVIEQKRRHNIHA